MHSVPDDIGEVFRDRSDTLHPNGLGARAAIAFTTDFRPRMVTGEATTRISAARALNDILGMDPRDKVPPSLAGLADTLVHLAKTDTAPSDDIVKIADTLFGIRSAGGDAEQPNAPLILLAETRNSPTVQMDGQPNA